MIRALLAFALLASCAPTGDIGADCKHSSTCPANRVCLALDPDKPTGAAACLPMPSVQGPIPCNGVDNGECLAAGFPIDSTCDQTACFSSTFEGACCVCNTITCDSNLQPDPATCTCTAKAANNPF